MRKTDGKKIRWEILVEKDSDVGRELKRLYGDIRKDEFFCSRCEKTVKHSEKFLLLPQPMEVITGRYLIRITVFCGKCGEALIALIGKKF